MLRPVDRTVVVGQGRVVDTGQHEELYRRNDDYRRLCDLQLVQPISES